MKPEKHHEELVSGIHEQLKEVFEKSTQGIYLYLDDTHKICNERFATLLGFKSADEWAHAVVSFEQLFAEEKSQDRLVSAYQNAMDNFAGSAIEVSWKKKSGETLDTTVILVPIAYKEHIFALHFVWPRTDR